MTPPIVSPDSSPHSLPPQIQPQSQAITPSSKQLPNPMDTAPSISPDVLLHEVSPANQEELTTSQRKTVSSTAFILTQGLNGVFHFVDRGISAAMTGVCRGTESVLFVSGMMRNDYAASLHKLKEMTGNENLGNFLSKYADHIATTMIPDFFEQGSYVNQTLGGEADFLKQLVGSMVLKVAVNIAKRLKQEGKEVSLVAIGSGVATLMNEMVDSSHEAFAEALKIENPKARELAMRNAALPIVDALLHLAFPKGASELPVRWGAHYIVWGRLREKLLQRVIPFQKLVQTVSATQSQTAQEMFLEKKMKGIGPLVEQEGSRFFADPLNVASFTQKMLTDIHTEKDEKRESLKGWLSSQLQQFGDLKNPSTATLWKFLGKGTEAAVSYMALHMFQSGRENGGGGIFSSLFKMLEEMSAFDRRNQETIHSLRQKLLRDKKDPETSPEYVECFKPLAAVLEKSFGISNLKSIVMEMGGASALISGDELFLQNLARAYHTDLLPAIQLYRAMEGSTDEKEALLSPINDSLLAAKQQLRQQLILPRGGVVICSLENASIVSEQMENLCGVIAQHAATAVQKKMHEEIKRQIGVLPDRLSSPGSIEVQSLYLKKVIQSSLMQMLAGHLKEEPLDQIQATNDSDQETAIARLSLPQMFRKYAKILEKHLIEDSEKIQAAALASEEPEKRQKALREAFQPLAKSLMQLAIPWTDKTADFPLDIPFQAALKASWGAIQDSVIPDILAGMYVDTTLWKRAESISRDTISAEIKTPYVPEACRVLAEWVHEFTPAFIGSNRKEISEGIYNGVAKYLVQSGNPEGVSVSQYLLENEDSIKKRLCENILSCIPPDGPLANATRPLTSQYMESFMLKLCSNMSVNINEAQGRTPEQQEMFMVNLGLHLLQAFNQHFSKVNEITGLKKRYAAYQVSHEDYIAGFGDKLHPGIPQTDNGLKARLRIKEALSVIDKERRLSQKEKDPVKQQQSRKKIQAAQATIRTKRMEELKERKKFFDPLVKSLIQLSGFKGPEDLALPESMRQSAWETFTTSLLPSVIESMFEVMARPETRVKLMLNGLESLNRAMDTIQPQAVQPEVVDDELQQKLNKACGELVLQLVQLVPHSMVQTAFKIDKFKILENQSAEIVGKAVRNYLGKDLNLLTLMDQGVQAGLTTLYPGGQWKPDSRGMLRFEPDKSKIKPVDISQMTDEALEQQERARLLQTDKEMQQMRKLMIKTTRRVMSESMMSGFTLPFLKLKQLWETFKAAWNRCVAKCVLPEKVSQFFRWVGETIIFRIIEAFLSFCWRLAGKGVGLGKDALSFALSPFREAFWFFMEIHLGRKADAVIKSLQLEIHENLLYQLTDVLVKSVTVENPFAESEAKLIEPLVVAAKRRSWLEKAQLITDLKWFGLNIAGLEILDE